MPIKVKRQLIEGTNASFVLTPAALQPGTTPRPGVLQTVPGLQDGVVERATVSGVTGLGLLAGGVVGIGDALSKFWEAANAVDADDSSLFIPSLGTESGDGFILSRIEAEGQATDIIALLLHFNRVGFIRASIRNFLTTKQTNQGWPALVDDDSPEAAVLQTVSYTHTTTQGPPGFPVADTQSGLVDTLASEAIYTVWRAERDDPADKARTYIGKLNAAGWSLFSASPAGTWLCEDVDSTFNTNTGLYDVGYQFHFLSETWISTVFYRGANGMPPADIEEASNEAATATFWTTKTRDFNVLNLLSVES